MKKVHFYIFIEFDSFFSHGHYKQLVELDGYASFDSKAVKLLNDTLGGINYNYNPTSVRLVQTDCTLYYSKIADKLVGENINNLLSRRNVQSKIHDICPSSTIGSIEQYIELLESTIPKDEDFKFCIIHKSKEFPETLQPFVVDKDTKDWGSKQYQKIMNIFTKPSMRKLREDKEWGEFLKAI